MEKRVFFQGDRNTSGETREAAIRIMRKLGEAGWKANVGAYGDLVKAICETGVKVRGHGFGVKDRPMQVDPDRFEFVDCAEQARLVCDSPSQVRAWTSRLATVWETSDAFIFFPGRQGTLAHLVPVLAFNIKGKDEPKKVALVGWNMVSKLLLLSFMGIGEEITWLGFFNLDEINQVVAFLGS